MGIRIRKGDAKGGFVIKGYKHINYRELEALCLVANGMDNKTGADLMNVTINTFKNHVQHVIKKLNAKNRANAIVKAVENLEVFSRTINGILSSSNRLPITGKQINPLACLAIKLIASAVTFSAARAKSPSFSLLSSSTIITNLPAFISSMASAMLDSPIITLSSVKD